MTLQELLDKNYQWFDQERHGPSIVPRAGGYDGSSISLTSNGCRYRGPNGCRCPMGVGIPDHRYKPEFEDHAASHVARCLNDIFGGISGNDLEALQSCHDKAALSAASPSDFTSAISARLKAFAEERGLRWGFPREEAANA